MSGLKQLGGFDGDLGRSFGRSLLRGAQTSAGSRWPLFTARKPDRIVTLASLSRRVPDEFIARTLARRLTEETDSKVLLVHLERTERKLTFDDWANSAPRVNGEFCFSKHLEFLAPRAERLHMQVPDTNGVASLPSDPTPSGGAPVGSLP